MPGWTVKGAYHWFLETESTSQGSPEKPLSMVLVYGRQPGGSDEEFPTEMDLQLIHKYNANTNISGGYSVFVHRRANCSSSQRTTTW